MTRKGTDFYASIPTFGDFAEAVRAENYRALPDDWVVGFADVIGSTKAVADGRYKAVNTVGASVIAAVSNAIGRRGFPFVFGGDGASFAVSGADAPAAIAALQATAVYSQEEFQMGLRVAAAPVAAVRAAGYDVRVARYGASPDCAYAMFSGGGLTWVEKQAKGGAFLLPPAPAGTRPDLSGLSCRWGVSPAKNGVILSVIVAPRGVDPRFPTLVEDIVRYAAAAADVDRPVTAEAIVPGKLQESIGSEAVMRRASGASRVKAGILAIWCYSFVYVHHHLKMRMPYFDMQAYKASLETNADFRKFDDGLRMTLDCSPAFADALEARLAAASDYVVYGTFRQTNAMLTCFVPSVADLGHIHFVDGAGGGYTMAAKVLKARAAAAA